ncbi:MAG: helix-hairpin-helix domain-containing protein [Pseudomonadota bacterium]
MLGAALAGSGSEEAPAPVADEAPAAEVEAAPELATDTAGDDLKQLKGVGPVLAEKLNDAGIMSFAQIAALSPEEIADVEEKVGASGKFEKEGWLEQAKELAAS